MIAPLKGEFAARVLLQMQPDAVKLWKGVVARSERANPALGPWPSLATPSPSHPSEADGQPNGVYGLWTGGRAGS